MKWLAKCIKHASKGMLVWATTEICALVELLKITNLTLEENTEDSKLHLKGLPFNHFH